MFVLDNVYKRRDLHKKYGGQMQGGITTPSNQKIIMLFTGERGQQYGYKDGWSNEGLFLYTGEGQRGDMQFTKGNLAIRDHTVNGKDLHLFENVNEGYVRYLGQMVCTGFTEPQGKDIDGKDRKVIIFELAPFDEFEIEVPSDNKELELRLALDIHHLLE